MDLSTVSYLRQWLGRVAHGLLILLLVVAATVIVLTFVAGELSVPAAESLLTAPVRWVQRA